MAPETLIARNQHAEADLDLLATAAAITAALDRLGHGIALADADGRICHANRIARRLGEEGDGLRIRDSQLTGVAMPEAQHLSEAFKCVAAGGPDVSLRLRRPSGRRPLFMRVAAVGSPPAGQGSCSPTALVLITDPDTSMVPSRKLLTEIYALTAAESALTQMLLQGRNLGEAARALSVQVTTARKQLRSVFAKTGTRRQADLVRVLLQEVGRLA